MKVIDADMKIMISAEGHEGRIELNKAIDVKNKSLELPSLTEFDIQCISDSINHNIGEICVILQRGKLYQSLGAY